MRYYRIEVANSVFATSHPNGVLYPPDRGALNVELDIITAGLATPFFAGGTGVKIWGIPLGMISQAKVFNGQTIKIFGGMGKGLPLANPGQAGLLFQGSVQQSFANWIGTQMSLDFVLTAPIIAGGTGASASIATSGVDQGSGYPANIQIDWPAGTQLSTAVQNTLKTAYPGYTIVVKISANLVVPSDQHDQRANLTSFATWLKAYSRDIIGANQNLGAYSPQSTIASTQQYQGVDIYPFGTTITVTDGTSSSSASSNATTGMSTTAGASASQPIQLGFNDLIGQPTWIGPQQLQVMTVMRGDLRASGFITLPITRATVTQSAVAGTGPALSPYNQNVIFQGTWYIGTLHHVGNYKDPSALSWVTVLNASPVPSPAADAGGAAVPVGSSPPNSLAPGGVIH
jgi:hypothetical protein